MSYLLKKWDNATVLKVLFTVNSNKKKLTDKVHKKIKLLSKRKIKDAKWSSSIITLFFLILNNFFILNYYKKQ